MSEPPSTTPRTLVVPAQFCGPTHSGNGGWTSGSLAGLIEGVADAHRDAWAPVEVTLRKPPPLDTPMTVTGDATSAVARSADGVVVEGRSLQTDLMPVEPVDPEVAALAQAHPAHLGDHPFKHCFVCGPERAPGDGLRIFPGRLTDDHGEGPGRGDALTGGGVAALWTPHPNFAAVHDPDDVARASAAVTWAALDCPGGWTENLHARPMVLGRMTARIDALPVIGEQHVVVAQLRGREGRKTFTASTLYDADGREVATAEHVWIAINLADFS